MHDPTAQQLQDDLEFMRRMYARRGPLNRGPRRPGKLRTLRLRFRFRRALKTLRELQNPPLTHEYGTTNRKAAWIVLAVITAAPALAALLLKLCL